MAFRSVRSRLVFGLAACTVLTSQTHAAVFDANPSNYQDLVAALAAGDTLRLASGTYTHGLSLGGKAGTAAQPIVVTGPDDQSAIFIALDCCNTVQLESTSYLQVLNLTVNGGRAAGVASRGESHDITIQNLKIISRRDSARTAGISTEGPAWNWTIRHNIIIGSGMGLHLGNADGTQPFVAAVIEYNLVRDTVGSNLAIEPQLVHPTGIELPGDGSAHTIIRHNVFSRHGAAVDSASPPASVLLGNFPLNSPGDQDEYEVYGNFFYENPAGTLLKGEGNVDIHDNLFVNSAGDGIALEPRHADIQHNTVVARGFGLRMAGGDPRYTPHLIANAIFAAEPMVGVNPDSGNVAGTYESAAESLNAPFAPIGSLDLFPRAGQLTATSASAASTQDFNSTPRPSATYPGAYQGVGTNPGWRPALAIKPYALTRVAALAAAAPTLDMSASPSSIAVGGTSVISWTTTGVDGCSASGGWLGTKGPNGSATVGPLQSTTSFQLTCLGAGGNANAIVQVTVGGSPANPPTTPPPTSPPGTPPTTPPPTQPTDPPVSPSPPTSAMKSGGGGAVDAMFVLFLGLVAFLHARRSITRRM